MHVSRRPGLALTCVSASQEGGRSNAPMTQPIELDLRHLPSPQPLLRALEAADALPPGEQLTIVAPMFPRPLLMELAQLGFEAEPGEPQADGSVRVQIRRPDDAEAAA